LPCNFSPAPGFFQFPRNKYYHIQSESGFESIDLANPQHVTLIEVLSHSLCGRENRYQTLDEMQMPLTALLSKPYPINKQQEKEKISEFDSIIAKQLESYNQALGNLINAINISTNTKEDQTKLEKQYCETLEQKLKVDNQGIAVTKRRVAAEEQLAAEIEKELAKKHNEKNYQLDDSSRDSNAINITLQDTGKGAGNEEEDSEEGFADLPVPIHPETGAMQELLQMIAPVVLDESELEDILELVAPLDIPCSGCSGCVQVRAMPGFEANLGHSCKKYGRGLNYMVRTILNRFHSSSKDSLYKWLEQNLTPFKENANDYQEPAQ
jgi:hypothetical protein